VAGNTGIEKNKTIKQKPYLYYYNYFPNLLHPQLKNSNLTVGALSIKKYLLLKKSVQYQKPNQTSDNNAGQKTG